MKTRLTRLAAGSLTAVALAGAQGASAQTIVDVSTRVPQQETKWVVDMVHSQVNFGVRHLVGRVRGTFTKWYATLITKEGDWKLGTVDVTVQTASLNTGNSYRDDDLRSDRFFSVARFPKMTFQGTGFAATDSTVDVSGILTIKGHSKPVVLSAGTGGSRRTGKGMREIAFQATGEVDRRDFGISLESRASPAPS